MDPRSTVSSLVGSVGEEDAQHAFSSQLAPDLRPVKHSRPGHPAVCRARISQLAMTPRYIYRRGTLSLCSTQHSQETNSREETAYLQSRWHFCMVKWGARDWTAKPANYGVNLLHHVLFLYWKNALIKVGVSAEYSKGRLLQKKEKWMSVPITAPHSTPLINTTLS